MKNEIYKHDDEYYYKIVRINVKKYRRLKGYTQQDLADLSGVSRQYICDIENESRNKHLTIAMLGRIADALDIDITMFFMILNTNEKQENKSLVEIN